MSLNGCLSLSPHLSDLFHRGPDSENMSMQLIAGGESPFLSTQRLPVHDSRNSHIYPSLCSTFSKLLLSNSEIIIIIIGNIFCCGGEITIVQSYKKRGSDPLQHIKVSFGFNYRGAFLNFGHRIPSSWVLWKRGFVLVSSRTSGKVAPSHWQWLLRFPGRIFDLKNLFQIGWSINLKTTDESLN